MGTLELLVLYLRMCTIYTYLYAYVCMCVRVCVCVFIQGMVEGYVWLCQLDMYDCS